MQNIVAKQAHIDENAVAVKIYLKPKGLLHNTAAVPIAKDNFMTIQESVKFGVHSRNRVISN